MTRCSLVPWEESEGWSLKGCSVSLLESCSGRERPGSSEEDPWAGGGLSKIVSRVP